MLSLKLEILTPEEVLANEDEVHEIIIPAEWGQMDILPQHADYVTKLARGQLVYRNGENKKSHNIIGGLIAIKDGKATILVEGLLASVTSLDEARAKRAA